MKLEYPYQLVVFTDKQPAIGEPVYYGEDGWYPQIALKRRFKLNDITEDELISKLADYCSRTEQFTVSTGELTQLDRIPVKVLTVNASSALMNFHNHFLSFMGSSILSRYPEREGTDYLPHITAEFNGSMVIDAKIYQNREYIITDVYLLKDVSDENSIAYKQYHLTPPRQPLGANHYQVVGRDSLIDVEIYTTVVHGRMIVDYEKIKRNDPILYAKIIKKEYEADRQSSIELQKLINAPRSKIADNKHISRLVLFAPTFVPVIGLGVLAGLCYMAYYIWFR